MFGITHPFSPRRSLLIDYEAIENLHEKMKLDVSESEAVSSSRRREILMYPDINVSLEEMRCKALYRHCKTPNHGRPLEDVEKWVAKARYITHYGDFSDSSSDEDDVVPLQQSMDVVYPNKDCSSEVRHPILEKKRMDPIGTGRPSKKSQATDIVKEDKEKSSSPMDLNGSLFDIVKEDKEKSSSPMDLNGSLFDNEKEGTPKKYPSSLKNVPMLTSPFQEPLWMEPFKLFKLFADIKKKSESTEKVLESEMPNPSDD